MVMMFLHKLVVLGMSSLLLAGWQQSAAALGLRLLLLWCSLGLQSCQRCLCGYMTSLHALSVSLLSPSFEACAAHQQ